MAEDMITRAIAALVAMDSIAPRTIVEGILTAALDPEDEEMMAWISCELSLDNHGEDIAYQVVASLRAMAQGEQRLSTAPAEQVQGQGEK